MFNDPHIYNVARLALVLHFYLTSYINEVCNTVYLFFILIGPSYSLSFKLTPTSTTADLIMLCLEKLERTEDFRLYSICELSPSKTKGKCE